MNSPAGRIFDIQRFSTHDGPGIRTTVFLKGCPLRCTWCHNPEAMSAKQGVSFTAEKCIACGECVAACPNGAHSLDAEHVYDRTRCEACGRCIPLCDARALELVGRTVTVEDVMREVRADRAFYARSGGGLTVSGGEPLAQAEFTCALLAAAREEGIHCAVETSGFGNWERLAAMLPLVDLFLYDWKESDPARHARFTGQSNEVVLRNLRALIAAGAAVQLQCPVVPGFNDRDDHLAGIASLAHSLGNIAAVQLLPYHPLGKSKLARFGIAPPPGLPNAPLDRAVLERWIGRLREEGIRVVNK
jgi:glycyl-radical enzyme activating protein